MLSGEHGIYLVDIAQFSGVGNDFKALLFAVIETCLQRAFICYDDSNLNLSTGGPEILESFSGCAS